MSKVTTLVTGGTGFVGQHVCLLLAERDTHVISFDKSTTLPPILSRIDPITLNNITFVLGNTTDFHNLMDILRKHKVQGIIHLDNQSFEASDAAPLQALRVNIEGTLNVLEAQRTLGLHRTVFLSSAAVYTPRTPPDQPYIEDEPTNPNPGDFFPLTKIAAERLCDFYIAKFHQDIVILRPSRGYGPPKGSGSKLPWVLPIDFLIHELYSGKNVFWPDGGDHYFDYTYIKDMASAIVKAYYISRKNLNNHVFNISSGNIVHTRDLINIFHQKFPNRVIDIGHGLWSACAYPPRSPLDITRAQKELSFQPKHDIEAGIQDYVNWLKS